MFRIDPYRLSSRQPKLSVGTIANSVRSRVSALTSGNEERRSEEVEY
jgi:hypothetical protein